MVRGRKKEFTKEYLIDALQRKAEELGKTPTMTDICVDPCMPSRATYVNYFGLYSGAVKEAGLQPNRMYSKEFLVKKLKEKAEELGKTPTKVEVDNDPDMPSGNCYKNTFERYNLAVKAAGLKPNKEFKED